MCTYFQLFIHSWENGFLTLLSKENLQMVSGCNEITSTQACHVRLRQTAVLQRVLLELMLVSRLGQEEHS